MTLLWMVVIAVLAVVLALWPLWAGKPGQGLRRRALNVAGYRSRLEEIDVEVKAGSVAPELAEPLREEASARLLADAEGESATAPAEAPERKSWVLFTALAVLIVAIAGVGYYTGDSRRQAALIAEAKVDPASAQQHAMDDMVGRLEERLKQQPDDAEGWAMLGRSYYVLGRIENAVGAYAQANRVSASAPRAEWLADEGEMRVLVAGHDFSGLPAQLFDRALAIEPQYPKALWYGGLASAQAGNYGQAVDRWQALRNNSELPEDFRKVLDQRLPELLQLAGRDPASSPSSAPSASVDAAPAAPVTETATPAAPGGAPQLVLDVEIAPEFANSFAASDTLFVLARRPEAGGPPLAVRRMGVSSLPARVTLDDSNAMAPGLNLSTTDRWEVIARVSSSGAPMAQSGDLEGRLIVTQAQSGQPLRLRIDRRVP